VVTDRFVGVAWECSREREAHPDGGDEALGTVPSVTGTYTMAGVNVPAIGMVRHISICRAINTQA